MNLSKPQAEAVYSAMCTLNNVGGKLDAIFADKNGGFVGGARAWEGIAGHILVDTPANRETYANQTEFAIAYGINSLQPA